MANKKIYKSANGQEIDMGQLALKNETVRAVGNMNVNARGDVIDNSNKSTSSRSSQVNKTYRKQIGNIVQDLPVAISKKAALAAAKADEEPIVGLDEVVEPKVEETVVDAGEKVKKGLAGAIAKAKKTSKKSK